MNSADDDLRAEEQPINLRYRVVALGWGLQSCDVEGTEKLIATGQKRAMTKRARAEAKANKPSTVITESARGVVIRLEYFQ